MRAPQTCANVGFSIEGVGGCVSERPHQVVALRHLFSLGYRLTCAEVPFRAKVSVSLEFRGSYGFHKFFHSPGNVLEALGLRFVEPNSGAKTELACRLTPKALGCLRLRSNCTRAAQYPDRQVKKRGEQSKYAVYGDAEDAKRQSQEPNDRKQYHREQGQRPAQDKQDAPEKKRGHG